MNAQEDVFAEAGQPTMGMSAPDFSAGFGSSAAPADDYSEEEMMLLR